MPPEATRGLGRPTRRAGEGSPPETAPGRPGGPMDEPSEPPRGSRGDLPPPPPPPRASSQPSHPTSNASGLPLPPPSRQPPGAPTGARGRSSSPGPMAKGSRRSPPRPPPPPPPPPPTSPTAPRTAAPLQPSAWTGKRSAPPTSRPVRRTLPRRKASGAFYRASCYHLRAEGRSRPAQVPAGS